MSQDPRAVAELRAMQLIPDVGPGREAWYERLKGPHPVHILAAADALGDVTCFRGEALMIAYTLHDAGLLWSGELESAQVLRLQPGDTITVTVDGPQLDEVLDEIRHDLEARFPDHPVAILRNCKFGVIRQDTRSLT